LSELFFGQDHHISLQILAYQTFYVQSQLFLRQAKRTYLLKYELLPHIKLLLSCFFQ